MQNFIQNFLVTFVFYFYISVVSANSLFTTCESLQWRCDNGQCIAVEDRCDGIKNCVDGSDETVEHCIHFSCPAYAFRCAYGACILGNYACNNRTDCVDGSDETNFLCNTSLSDADKDKILQGNCQKSLQLECRKGECIDRDRICDGRLDCSNNKDETIELCSSMYCSKFAFRCGYGGCIPGNKKCNGKKDCLDGSDETSELCNHTEVPEYCFIPVERRHLVVTNLNGNRMVKPGDRVVSGTRLKFKCDKGWHLIGAMRSVCDVDGWSNQVPYCTKYCSNYKLHRGLSTTATCSYNEHKVSCDEAVIHGTIAKIRCAPGYALDEDVVSSPGEVMRCNGDGEWSNPKLQCQPRCGVINNSSSTSMPWDVSIFRLVNFYEFRCYGTILSPKIVIGVQKCFSEISFADIDEHEMYNIVAGNYTNNYERLANPGQFVFNVSEIYIPYTPDNSESIAILVLVKYFDFSTSLAPICVQMKKLSTASYENVPDDFVNNRRPAELGASISKTQKIADKAIHYLVAIWGSTHKDSRLNPINVSSLDGVIRKFIERYENIY